MGCSLVLLLAAKQFTCKIKTIAKDPAFEMPYAAFKGAT
jgi:hypothetical protein